MGGTYSYHRPQKFPQAVQNKVEVSIQVKKQQSPAKTIHLEKRLGRISEKEIIRQRI